MTNRDQDIEQTASQQRAPWTTPVLTRIDATEAEQSTRQRAADGGATFS